MQEFSNKDGLLVVFDFEGEPASKPGEEFLEEDEEVEQPERLSFVNSSTKRELRGACREVRDSIKQGWICSF